MSVTLLAALLCALVPVAASACPSTCYEGTCDHWDGGYWGTCATLSTRYGCDCGGCECDGCPQGGCEEAPFNPSSCPKSGNSMCDESDNTEACAWDGGDCCPQTCVGTLCGSYGYTCRSPNLLTNEADVVLPQLQQQVPNLYAEVNFRVHMGEAPANWNLFGSLTQGALATTLGYGSIKILGMELAPCRRLQADEALPRTRVAIRFSAWRNNTVEYAMEVYDMDMSNLQFVMQGLLDKAGSGIIMLSADARECQDASCESFGGSGGSGADRFSGAENMPERTGNEESMEAEGPAPALFGVAAAFGVVIIALVSILALLIRRRRAACSAPVPVGGTPTPATKPTEVAEAGGKTQGPQQACEPDLEVPRTDGKSANYDIASNSTAEPSKKDGDIDVAEDRQWGGKYG